ncbi:ion transporter [Pseudorhodoplanes sp.]|uniref:ion transporter n=1 Tax=Pseudorhodoplanes sp. TaxID=1934341 RepID=UPI00391C3CAF
MTTWLRSILDNPRTEWFITAVIVLNAITLGLETSKSAMDAYGPVLLAIDAIVLTIFVIELSARIFVHRLAFFKDPWSLFDFAVVAIALIPSTGNLSVLRALRILRVMRLITVVPSLRRVVGGLITALPGMGSIVALLALIYYVFSVMATKLFAESFPEWFGNIGASAYSLFQIMTLESWSMGIVRPVMEKYPYAWAFFVPYIIMTTFAVLNLFIGVVVNAMQTEHEKGLAEEREAEREMLHQETEPIIEEMKRLRAEIAELKQHLIARSGDPQPAE